MRRAPAIAFLMLPAVAAAIFVARFATAMPLTDEWFFTGKVLALEDVHVFTGDGFAELLRIFPTRFGDHLVVIPFLAYWPLSLWSHFDNRALIAVTCGFFGLEAFLFRRQLVRSSLWVFPLVLLLFSPSHYIELLWGWQFTFGFSIVFAVAGLCVLDGTAPQGSLPRLLAAVLLFFCAAWSCAGGFFGFPAGLLLIALKPYDRRFKALSLAVLAVATVAAALQLSHHPALQRSFGLRDVAYVLTALGATVWGSPVGLTEFGVDLRSLTGLVFCLAFAVVLVRAARVRALPRLALALSIALFGFLAIATIAVARDYLGNWHLQYALFAICGGYGAAYTLWRQDRSRQAAGAFAVICLLTLCSVFGLYNGFATYGPSYRAYVASIERYARQRLEDPQLPRPFPRGSALSPELILYLSALHHPVFHDELANSKRLDPGARVYFDNREVALPFDIAGGDEPNIVPLTVTLPSGTPAHRLLARIGGETLVLRRLSQRGAIPLCANPATVCFGGLVLRRTLPRAPHQVTLVQLTE